MEKMNITHKIVAMQPELEHFAYKLTADRESANDLVQDCLLKALDNKEKFVHTQNFKGWMYTIMRNIFINNYRKSLREVDMTDSTYNLYAQTMTEGEEGNQFETIYDLKELYKGFERFLVKDNGLGTLSDHCMMSYSDGALHYMLFR